MVDVSSQRVKWRDFHSQIKNNQYIDRSMLIVTCMYKFVLVKTMCRWHAVDVGGSGVVGGGGVVHPLDPPPPGTGLGFSTAVYCVTFFKTLFQAVFLVTLAGHPCFRDGDPVLSGKNRYRSYRPWDLFPHRLQPVVLSTQIYFCKWQTGLVVYPENLVYILIHQGNNRPTRNSSLLNYQRSQIRNTKSEREKK